MLHNKLNVEIKNAIIIISNGISDKNKFLKENILVYSCIY